MTPQERSESARRAVTARWAKSRGKQALGPVRPQMDPETRRAVELFLTRIRPQFAVATAILYGSRARGEHRPDSDADLAIVLASAPESAFSVLSRMVPDATEVLLETGISVAPLLLSCEEWAHREQQPAANLLRTIAREGISV